MLNKCVVCGNEFEAVRSTKKYCSIDCQNTSRREKYANRERVSKDISYKGNLKICPICGKEFYPLTAMASQRTCCYDCMPNGVQLTRGMFLAKIKESRGGKCIRCGYDKCIKALEFHHIDPSKKDFTISSDRFHLLDAVEESKKCILICSNCHKELHDNMWNIEDLNIEEREEVEL
jgi:hypothetical protein